MTFPWEGAIPVPHVNITKCLNFSILWARHPPFTYWSAVFHASQRTSPARHVSVMKCPWSRGKMVAMVIYSPYLGIYLWCHFLFVTSGMTSLPILPITILPPSHLVGFSANENHRNKTRLADLKGPTILLMLYLEIVSCRGVTCPWLFTNCSSFGSITRLLWSVLLIVISPNT